MDSLVTTTWLAHRLGDPALTILDASMHLPAAGRDAAAEHAAGHIPGARFLDLASLRDTASGLPNTLPTGAQAATRFGALGITPESRVVLYDDSDIRTSARTWFVLRGFGVSDVAILDGGLVKWRSERRALATGHRHAQSGLFAPAAFAGPVRDKAQMRTNIAARAEQVIDARDPARFSGKQGDGVHGAAGGHIPGSRNLHYRDLFAADGTYLPPNELRAAFERAGVDLARPIVTSCGSGVTAAVLLFALHLLGYDGAALYDGSWAEWGADPTLPKETG